MIKPKKKAPVAVQLERPRGGGSFVRDPATGQLTRVIEEPQSEAEAGVESAEGSEPLDPADPKTDPAGKTGDNEQEA